MAHFIIDWSVVISVWLWIPPLKLEWKFYFKNLITRFDCIARTVATHFGRHRDFIDYYCPVDSIIIGLSHCFPTIQSNFKWIRNWDNWMVALGWTKTHANIVNWIIIICPFDMNRTSKQALYSLLFHASHPNRGNTNTMDSENLKKKFVEHQRSTKHNDLMVLSYLVKTRSGLHLLALSTI